MEKTYFVSGKNKPIQVYSLYAHKKEIPLKKATDFKLKV